MGVEVMTLREVADFLKVHPNTIYRLARTGRLPAFKVGTDWRFHRAAVDSWALRRRSRPEAPAPEAPEEEVLYLINWMLGQGFALTIAPDEIAELLDWTPRRVKGALSWLVDRGWLRGAERRYALTPDGLREARRRFEPKTGPPSGHESVAIFAERFVGP